MLKHVYKAIILFAIFIGSVYYFGRDIKEEVFNIEKTIQMSDATFPIITLRTGEEDINVLHGFSNNLDANIVRESITPLDSEQRMVVVIDENENEVKRVIYELRSVIDNKLIETDTINALDKEETYKTAKIKIKAVLEEKEEYALKITLVTSKSKKMHFYTRVKLQPDSYYEEKIDFVMDFHNTLMDKKKAEDIIRYLEPDTKSDNSSLAYVNIHSSFDLVSWGNLAPQVMGEIIPTIKETSSDISSIELKYKISAKTDSGLEYYNVKEFFRVRYTSSRMYLLNYERTMESIFDLELTSLTKSEFKIGITNNKNLELFTSKDNNKLCFVSERELWYYNLAENSAVKVFSFLQEDSDNVRDSYAEHNVRVLNMDEDGNINFIVYGYMNRGVYEGRVGIILYKFYSGENRIEELVYIPMNITYQMLKEELNDFSYVNQLGTYYFTINHRIYSYNLITKELVVIASGIRKDNFVVSKELHYIAWQDSSNPSEAKNIILLDLETGFKKQISATEDNNINLLGKINDNIIYGYVKTKDITTTVDGKTLVPMYQIEISDEQHKILKKYYKEGYYVTDTIIEDNVITLERMKKIDQNGKIQYELTEPDNILNKIKTGLTEIGLTTRVTEKTLTELYIYLPSGYSMDTKPKYSNTINTIISVDTTLRLEENDEKPERYVVYAFGGIEGYYEEAGIAINQASSYVGVVLDPKHQIIWERGIKNAKSEIKNIEPIYENDNVDSIMASAQMLLNSFRGSNNSSIENQKETSAYELLHRNMGDSILNLTGCNLEDILYYVSKDRPVLAMKDQKNAVLIIGYDTYNITVIDPKLHKTMKIGLNDSIKMFTDAGSIFISYSK